MQHLEFVTAAVFAQSVHEPHLVCVVGGRLADPDDTLKISSFY
jgi:hypothetical protein